jgi:hypothetical protein
MILTYFLECRTIKRLETEKRAKKLDHKLDIGKGLQFLLIYASIALWH